MIGKNKTEKELPKTFNRKTFDPEHNDIDLAILYKLRNKGWTRRVALRQAIDNGFKGFPQRDWTRFHKLQSTALWYLRLMTEPWQGERVEPNYKGKVFADFGCGQSPDGLIAIQLGFKKSIMIDLFKVRTNWEPGLEFIQADICEKLPIKEASIDHAISQAVIDLIEPAARPAFYKNVYKALKPGGYFAVYIINLHVGHGFNVLREIENCMDVGFHLERKFNDGFVMQK